MPSKHSGFEIRPGEVALGSVWVDPLTDGTTFLTSFTGPGTTTLVTVDLSSLGIVVTEGMVLETTVYGNLPSTANAVDIDAKLVDSTPTEWGKGTFQVAAPYAGGTFVLKHEMHFKTPSAGNNVCATFSLRGQFYSMGTSNLSKGLVANAVSDSALLPISSIRFKATLAGADTIEFYGAYAKLFGAI